MGARDRGGNASSAGSLSGMSGGDAQGPGKVNGKEKVDTMEKRKSDGKFGGKGDFEEVSERDGCHG